MSLPRGQGWIVIAGALAVFAHVRELARVKRADVPPRPEMAEITPAPVATAADGSVAIAEFETWLDAYEAASPEERTALVPAGLRRARARRADMRTLIETNPALALEVAVSGELRGVLPPAIRAEIERDVSGAARLIRMCATSGAPADEGADVHLARVGDETFTAHPYGRRAGLRGTAALSLHGIALDGHLAVADSPLRRLSTEADGAVVVEVFGERRRLANHTEAYALERELVMEEQRSAAASEAMPEGRALGGKRFLVVPVDFRDVAGALAGNEGMRTFFDDVGAFFYDNSRGALAIDFTLVPDVVRMPVSAAEYVATRGPYGLLDDALAAVRPQFGGEAFDCVVLLFPNIAPDQPGNFYWAGLGGGGNVWINGALRKDVVCHEIGHHLGVGHASAWAPADDNPLSRQGRQLVYGDNADAMASTADGIPGHFNPVFKNRLGWLPDSAVTGVTQSGVYRIWSHDAPADDFSRPVALRLFRGQRDLWVSFREQVFPHLAAYATGATVLRAGLDGYQVEILDLNTPGLTTYDSPLQPGQALSDPDYGVTIRALARTGAGVEEHMDFEVTIDPLPANVLVDYGVTVSAVDEDTLGVRRFSSGSLMSLAALENGTLKSGGPAAWVSARTAPIELARPIAVDARADLFGLNAAVDISGRAFVWGDNSAVVAALPAELAAVRDVAVSANEAMILHVDGRVSVYGETNVGAWQATDLPADVVQVASNLSASVFLRRDGTVHAPGIPGIGEASGLTDLVAIAVSDTHLIGLRADGTVTGFSWGGNAFGEADPPAGLRNVRQIAADNGISAALTEDGRLVRWGESQPVHALPERPIAAIDVRGLHHLVLINDGEPHITLEPRPAPLLVGSGVRFTAFATGASALDYRWELRAPGCDEWKRLDDDGVFTGVHTTSLTIGKVPAELAGFEFRCVVADQRHRTTASMPAALIPSDIAAPTITGGNRLVAGESLVLACAFDAAASIQWYRNGIAIPGADRHRLLVGAGDEDPAGNYTVAATTSFGVFVSGAFEVAVESPPVAAAPAGRLVNLSARARAGEGTAQVIMGFVVEGSSAGEVLVRATGPALSAFGVTQALSDPALEVQRTDGFIAASNDDWWSGDTAGALATAATVAGAFALPPGTRDAAVLTEIAPGAYTATVRAGDEQGIVLLEAYELFRERDLRFVNLSIRAVIDDRNEPLIAGLVIAGGNLPVLIRAVGAGLRPFGVSEALDDPRLTVLCGGEVIGTCDSWTAHRVEVEEVQARCGAFALSAPQDAAFIANLEPGLYSIRVDGVAHSTGVVLVEVYDVR